MKLTLGKALRKGFIKRLRILGRSADDQVVPVQVMDRDDEVEPFDDIDKRLFLPGTDAQDLEVHV